MARAKNGKESHLTLDASTSEPASPSNAARRAKVAFHLDIADVDELRGAIERSLCEGELHDSSELFIDGEIRKSLRVACAKARLQRVRAEHVLVDLKQIWMSMPSMLSTRTSNRLSEIVTACIDEYYAKDQHPEI